MINITRSIFSPRRKGRLFSIRLTGKSLKPLSPTHRSLFLKEQFIALSEPPYRMPSSSSKRCS